MPEPRRSNWYDTEPSCETCHHGQRWHIAEGCLVFDRHEAGEPGFTDHGWCACDRPDGA